MVKSEHYNMFNSLHVSEFMCKHTNHIRMKVVYLFFDFDPGGRPGFLCFTSASAVSGM